MEILLAHRNSELLSEARAYLRRGWVVLPVDEHKHPASRLIRRTRGHYGWKPLRNRPADSDEVQAWVESDPRVGIGVITGEPSQLAVIDIDDESQAPDLPPSATARTPRGRHVFCRCDTPTRSQPFPWGDLKADGGYVVAPPSRGYRWEISPDEIGELANFARVEGLLTPICSTCLRGCKPERLRDLNPFQGFDLGASDLRNLERSATLAFRLAAPLGVPEGLRLGEAFPCVLHPDRWPSAALWRHEEHAHVLYHDFHAGVHDGQPWLSLAMVRARLAGRQGPLAAPELTVWKLRLGCEAGLLEPLPLDFDAAPPPQSLAVAWDGFLYLLALRWLVEPGLPAPFSARFAAAWCGLSKWEAHKAVSELARRGYLRLQGFDSQRNRLWLPQGVRPPA